MRRDSYNEMLGHCELSGFVCLWKQTTHGCDVHVAIFSKSLPLVLLCVSLFGVCLTLTWDLTLSKRAGSVCVLAMQGGERKLSVSIYFPSLSWRGCVDASPPWLILPVVICLFQRLSHACLSLSCVSWVQAHTRGETADGSLNLSWSKRARAILTWIPVVIPELIHAHT